MDGDLREAPAERDAVEHRGHDVFVSYSRVDREAVLALTEGLAARGKRAWVDLEDIPPSAEWMGEIRTAIDGADAYLVVVSPDLARSKVCSVELDHARAGGKRVVPVLVRPTDPETVPEALSSLNWIDASDPGRREAALDGIVRALETDLDAVKAHTRLLVRAGEWERGGEEKSLLLRGRELTEAERTIADAEREPRPTQLQTRFVLASRKAAGRRQRGAISIVTVLLVIAAALGVAAWDQRNAAVESERVALEKARESRSRELAAASVGQLEIDPELSLLLATEAMKSANTPEALEALRLSLTESRVRATLTGHEGAVVATSYSPDGERLLTASYDGTARIWDVGSNADPLVLAGHEDLVETAAFSPDGSLVVTASFDGTARVWDATTGDEVATLRGHRGAVHDAAFSPDGKLVVTAGDDGTARVWDVRDGRQLRVLKGHTRPIYDVSFSPDGKLVVTASDDDTARLWDARTGKLFHVLEGHEDGLYAATFDPDGERVVTASEDETARVWDATSGRLVANLVSGGPVVAASFSQDGTTVLTASEDSTARIWDASSGRQILAFRGHADELNAASFNPDGSLVLTASADGTARIWDAQNGTELAALRGHHGPILTATFSPDGGEVVTGGVDGAVRVWEPLAGRVVLQGNVSWAFPSLDGTMIAVSTWDGGVYVLDAETGRQLLTIDVGVPQTSASISGDGTLLASGGVDGVGRVWDVASGELVAQLRGHKPVWMAADFFDQNDRVLTWSDDGTARLWDPRSGEELAVFRHGRSRRTGGIWEAHLSPDGSRVFTTGTIDGVVRMWDAVSGNELWSADIPLRTGGIGAEFAPDGRSLGTASSGQVTIWDAESGRKVVTLADPNAHGMVFSPDGKTVATRSSDGSARVWDPRTGELLTEMAGHPSTVNSVWFSHDGTWVATTADDGKSRVWAADTGELVATYGGDGSGRGSFAFFTGDDHAVVSSTEGAVRIDRCDACGTPEELLELARTRLTRGLTDAERAEYLGASSREARTSPPRPAGLIDATGAPAPDGLLPPGVYRAVGFDPGLSFEVQDGWQVATFLDVPEEGEVQHGVSMQLLQVGRQSNGMSFIVPGRLIDGRKEWDERRSILPFPKDFLGWLSSHPDLDTGRVKGISVGGVDGAYVDTVVTSVPDNSWPVCGACVALMSFTLHNETGPITDDDLTGALGPGEIDRWIVLETGGNTILVDAWSASKKDFRDFMPIVHEVLETVQLEA